MKTIIINTSIVAFSVFIALVIGSFVGVNFASAQTVTTVNCSSATLQGTVIVNPAGVSTEAWFEWGTTYSFNSSTARQSYTSTSQFSQSITNLSPNTTYYYRARAQNSYGQATGQTLTLTTPSCNGNYGNYNYNNNYNYGYNYGNYYGGQTSVVTNAATWVSQYEATMNGYSDPYNTGNTTVWFQWGTNPNFLPNETNRMNQLSGSSFKQVVTGLSPNTTYYFRAVASNQNGTIYGNTMGFTTTYLGNVFTGGNYSYNSGNYQNTTIVTNLASSLTQTSARLNGLALSNGNLSTQGWFEWGTSASLGSRTDSKNVGSAPSVAWNETITGLSDNTTYYYRASGQNSAGTFYGDIVSFKTGFRSATVVQPTVSYISNTRVSTSQPSLVILDVTSEDENVIKGDQTEINVTWRNISASTLSNVVLRVGLPKEYRFLDSTKGIYSEIDNTVTYDIETLSPGEEGKLSIEVEVAENPSLDKVLVTTGNLVYTIPSGAQEEVIAYVVQKPLRGPGLAALSLFGGDGFLPTTLAGWLLLAIIILILVILSRNLYGSYREAKEA